MVKVGGWSMATPESIMTTASTIRAMDEAIVAIIVSAPGEARDQEKVTALLRKLCKTSAERGELNGELYTKLERRLVHIVRKLRLRYDPNSLLAEIRERAIIEAEADFVISRGEVFSAHVLAEILDLPILDPQKFLFLTQTGTLRETKTRESWSTIKSLFLTVIVPGFFGEGPEGLMLLPPGSSDRTAAWVAQLSGATTVVKLTNTSIRTADPRLVTGTRVIKRTDLGTFRYLADASGVVEPFSARILKRHGITLRVVNSSDPNDPHTLVIPNAGPLSNDDKAVVSIAGRHNITILMVDDYSMATEVGITAFVARLFTTEGIPILYDFGPDDEIAFAFDGKLLTTETRGKIMNAIMEHYAPDDISFESGIGIICITSLSFPGQHGTLAKITQGLADAGINVRTGVQSPRETRIIIGVAQNDYDRALQAIHDLFYPPN